MTLKLLLLCLLRPTLSLMFRSEQFKEVSPECKSSDGKPLTYILNEEKPALYVSVDPYVRLKKSAQQHGGQQSRRPDHKLFSNEARLPMHDIHYGDPTFSLHHRLGGISLSSSAAASANYHLAVNNGHYPNGGRPTIPSNGTFDCQLLVQTELPKGDKSKSRFDALSLMVVQLQYGNHPRMPEHVQITTFGHRPPKTRRVTKNAQYADRMWAAANPNFLLSGQLSGFDSIDYRTKVEPQHLVKPETLHSTFDKPAAIKVNITRWNANSHIYLVFTSYKYLRHGERCREHKEFDCAPQAFLASTSDHLCMSQNLACDGLPNCGQDFLPNQDENCFKIHWSSILLSLVSYVLLAVTLLLCLSCFAKIVIQWSVRSSIAEIRGRALDAGIGGAAGGGGGMANSPTGSFRSSSRFFSFLGNTFASRWERPPPTYDEALKHENPDLARPPAPPAYSDSDYQVVSLPGQQQQQNDASTAVWTPAWSSMSVRRPTRPATAETASTATVATETTTATSMQQIASSVAAETPPPEYDHERPQPHLHHHRQQHHLPLNLNRSSSSRNNNRSSSSNNTLASPPRQPTAVPAFAVGGQPALIVVPPTPMEPSSSTTTTPTGAAAAAAMSPPPTATAPTDSSSDKSKNKSKKDAATRVVEAEIYQTHL